MSKPVDIAATATPQSQQPPLATQVQAQTVNDSLQNDSIANLRQISGALLAVHRCLTELQQHVDSIRISIDSILPPHTTNTTPLATSSPQAAASPPPAADTTSTPVPVPESSWESDPSEEEEEGKEEEKEVRSSPRSELISTHRSELETLCEKEKDKEEEEEEEDVRSPPRSELISAHCSELESLCYKKVKVEDKEEEDVRCPPRSELISTHCSELESLCYKKVKVEDKEEEDERCPPRSELISTHCSELESLCYKEVKVEDKEEEAVRCPPRSELISTHRSELGSLCDKEVIEEDKEEGDVRCPPRSELESLCDKEVIEEDKEEEDVRCPPRSELESLCDKEVIEEDKEEEEVRCPPRSELGSLCEKEVTEEDKEEENVRFPPCLELISTPRSELESLCKMMDGRGLWRYMVRRLYKIKGLLELVPKALRLSSNPARLVLECVGKFYTQNGKSFDKDPEMVKARKASVLVLECFLLMGISDEIEIGVKQEAQQAALAWRKRLIAEGGVLKAKEIDARGLLMLVGCFGIPERFKNEDIRDLIWVIFLGQGRICKIIFSDSLRRSNVLMAKIPDIIEEMAKQKMEVDAAHIAYTFVIEDRVNPKRFLTSFLLESEESLKKLVEQSQVSLADVDQAKRKHLFDLRSVIKCLELHDIDPSELLPGWQINEKIMSLEKEITVGENLNKKKIARAAKRARKRKIDETESSRKFSNKEVIEEDKEEGDVRCPPRSELESLCDKEVIEEDKEEEDVRCPPRSELGSLCEKEMKEEDKEEENVRFPPCSELISTPRSELESLCEMMDGRGLRRYMVMHLSDIKGLLEQVPKALRLSSNPARLVLECVGKFYTQKGKSFDKDSQMVKARKASVLVLECFLLMGIRDEIEIGVKQEAEQAALAWRKRLIAEAGILKAKEIDARGLLMLVGCFGIPGRFKNEDIRDLIWVIFIGQGRISEILFSGSLRRSNVLMAKIPDIIEEMAKQKMEVDAAHIAYTFGIEDRVNPKRFLTSFLLESEELLKKMVEQSQVSLAAVDQAKRKHLVDLRSVIKCLELHDIDPSELLPEWQINEKIMSLEKEITIGENLKNKEIARAAKRAQKRKIDETESSRKFSNKEPKHSHVPNPWLQQERVYSTPGQIGSHTGQLYRWPGNAAVYDGLASCSYAHPFSYLYRPR